MIVNMAELFIYVAFPTQKIGNLFRSYTEDDGAFDLARRFQVNCGRLGRWLSNAACRITASNRHRRSSIRIMAWRWHREARATHRSNGNRDKRSDRSRHPHMAKRAFTAFNGTWITHSLRIETGDLRMTNSRKIVEFVISGMTNLSVESCSISSKMPTAYEFCSWKRFLWSEECDRSSRRQQGFVGWKCSERPVWGVDSPFPTSIVGLPPNQWIQASIRLMEAAESNQVANVPIQSEIKKQVKYLLQIGFRPFCCTIAICTEDKCHSSDVYGLQGFK